VQHVTRSTLSEQEALSEWHSSGGGDRRQPDEDNDEGDGAAGGWIDPFDLVRRFGLDKCEIIECNGVPPLSSDGVPPDELPAGASGDIYRLATAGGNNLRDVPRGDAG